MASFTQSAIVLGALNKAERNYSISRLELLAVVYSIQHWRHYLQANHFHLYTDHKALTSLLTSKKLTPQLVRHGLILQAYDFEIHHTRGLLNGASDALSRVRYVFEHTANDDFLQSYPHDPPVTGNASNDRLFKSTDDTVEHCLYAMKRQMDLNHHKHSLVGNIDLSDSFANLFGVSDNDTKPVATVRTVQELPKARQAAKSHAQAAFLPHDSGCCADSPYPKGDAASISTAYPIVLPPVDPFLNPDAPAYSLRDKPHRSKQNEEAKKQSEKFSFAPSHPSADQFRSNQRLDPITHVLYRYHVYKELPNDRRLARKIDKYLECTVVSDGIVLIKAHSHVPSSDMQNLVFVPQPLTDKVIASLHNSTSSAHLGVTKTIHLAQDNYYWPTLAKDIRTYIGSCDTCLSFKRSQHRMNPPLESFPIPTGPNQRIHVDLLGPLPLSSTKLQYVAVIVDAFTKLLVTFPLRHKTSIAFLQGMHRHYICNYGIPQFIYADNGGEFKNELMADLCRVYNIRHATCSGYTPKANGLAERSVQTITNLLRTSVSNSPKSWDVLLHHVTFMINATVSTATGYSPFFLTFGRYPNLHDSAYYKGPAICHTQYVAKLVHELSRVHALVHNTLHVKHKADKQRYDNHAKQPNFSVGDIVFLYKPSPSDSRKLSDLYEGPFVITTCLPRNKVLIRHLHTMQPIPEPLHISRLKLSRNYVHNSKL